MMTTTRSTLARWAAAAALGVAFAAPVAAQQTPARDPAPAAPQAAPAPALVRPQAAPPPPAPGAPAANRATQAAAAAPVQPASRASALPPDSVRPATSAAPAAAAAQPPANAVARCADGSYVAAADACGSRGGLLVLLPASGSRAAPQRPVPTAAGARPAAAAAQPAAVATAAPPPGATMRCKDGTYLTGEADANRCASNGGLAAILPAPRVDPAGPPQPRRP